MTASWSDMALAAESDLIGKRQRIEQCRKNKSWPVDDLRLKEAALPIFEEIARVLRLQAEKVAREQGVQP